MGWIGVDLDGTLAHYESGQYPEIGEPIKPMMDRVQKWLEQGREVRICTARAAHGGEDIARVQKWLDSHGLGQLPITNEKDPDMDELWDDKAIQVKPNTGEPIVDESFQKNLAETLSISKEREDSHALSERLASYSTWVDDDPHDEKTFGLMKDLESDTEK